MASVIEARVYGDNPVVLRIPAEKAREIIEEDPIHNCVRLGWNDRVTVFLPQIRKDRMQSPGLTRTMINNAILTGITGATVGDSRDKDKSIPILFGLLPEERGKVESLQSLLAWPPDLLSVAGIPSLVVTDNLKVGMGKYIHNISSYREVLFMLAQRKYAVIVIVLLLCALFSPPGLSAVHEEVMMQDGRAVRLVKTDGANASVSSMQSVGTSPSLSGQGYIPGDVIAVFKSPSRQSGYGVSAEYLSAAADSVGAKVVETYGELSAKSDGVFARLKIQQGTEAQTLEQLRARSDVAGVQLNYRYTVSGVTPSDTKFGSLWGMPAINAPEAWELDNGSDNVYVAVIDTGIDYSHPDIKNNFETSGYSGNYSSGTAAGDYSDGHGHGTHVAGTIGAVGNNGLGVVGVNWSTKLISLRIFDSSGGCSTTEILDELNALLKLLDDHPGLKIASVNMSYGRFNPTTERPETLLNTPEYLAYKVLSDTNRIVLCVAAGNEA